MVGESVALAVAQRTVWMQQPVTVRAERERYLVSAPLASRFVGDCRRVRSQSGEVHVGRSFLALALVGGGGGGGGGLVWR